MEKELQDEMQKKYAKIVAKAWADEDYKKNLLQFINLAPLHLLKIL